MSSLSGLRRTISDHSNTHSSRSLETKFPLPPSTFDSVTVTLETDELLRKEAELYLQKAMVTRKSFNCSDSRWKFMKKTHDVDMYQHLAHNQDGACVVVAVGTAQGRMEDIIHAEYSDSTAALRNKSAFIDNKTIRDSHVLHNIETISDTLQEDGTFQYLGIKYIYTQIPIPGIGKILRHRDYVFYELLGIAITVAGEKIGFHTMQSCELSDMPVFPGVRRGHFGAITIYENCGPDKVRLFSQGTIASSIGPNDKKILAQCMNLVSRPLRTILYSECKKLSYLAEHPTKPAFTNLPTHHCSSCYRKHTPNLLGLHKPRECHICYLTMCSKCLVKRSIFVSEQLKTVRICQKCIFDSKAVNTVSIKPSSTSISQGIVHYNFQDMYRGSTVSSTCSISKHYCEDAVSWEPSLSCPDPAVDTKNNMETQTAFSCEPNMNANLSVRASMDGSDKMEEIFRTKNCTRTIGTDSHCTEPIPHREKLLHQMLQLQQAAELAYELTRANQSMIQN